jgi:hypothetical protein
MRTRIVLTILILVFAACGGSSSDPVDGTVDSSDGGSGGSISSPCDLADASLVSAHFAGTVADGVEGVARNCTFEISDGDVASVDVFYYGDASGWDGSKSGFESNRGGVTDVGGLGDAAFFPNDRGELELVVQAGGEIFSVTAYTNLADLSPDDIASVSALAAAIADNLG